MVTSPTDTPERRVSSVGRVVPHIEVKIVDSSGMTVQIGEAGEIHTRGYSTMLGYWDDPDTTAKVIDPEGWVRTGDIGVFDEHGYGRIVGRIKEMVIRGGEEYLLRRDRGFLAAAPRGGERAGRRRAGRQIWRRALCMHKAQAGRKREQG